MKKLLFLMVAMVCVSFGQAYADYSLNIMSSDGQYGLTGTLYAPSNGNGQVLVTGASLTGDGNSNNGISYALLAPFLTAHNMNPGGADLFQSDNLLFPGSNPVFNTADSGQGMIFVQSAGLSVVNGSVNSGTNAVPAIGIWANGPDNYVIYDALGQESGTVSITPLATPTPIPAAAWLFGSGLMGLVGIRKKLS